MARLPASRPAGAVFFLEDADRIPLAAGSMSLADRWHGRLRRALTRLLLARQGE